uniref:Uncharacterized protein n=1 Tax=Thermoplasma acidophilum TaxID=2303 RepID=Q0KKY0_THEAI|nr:hypothetical protein [Cloning vector pSTA]BAF30830.1 hypothetical protein [Thermoplasma acidophilum]
MNSETYILIFIDNLPRKIPTWIAESKNIKEFEHFSLKKGTEKAMLISNQRLEKWIPVSKTKRIKKENETALEWAIKELNNPEHRNEATAKIRKLINSEEGEQ